MKRAVQRFADRVEVAVSALGRVCGWLLLLLVVVQFLVVSCRYALGINYLWAQELALYLHASVFMMAAGWTLLADRHVRIDVFREKMSVGLQNWSDRLGFALLLVPMIVVILIFSHAYVVESWQILEGSPEVSGLPGRFLLKSLIPLFALLLLVAGVCRMLRK